MRVIRFEDIDPNGHIYVKSIAGRGKKAGDVNIDLRHRDGKPLLVIVPKTFIPIRITDQAPAKLFLDSPSFRIAVSKKVIIPIHPDDAEQELKTSAAITELERIRRDLFGINFETEENTLSAIEAISAIAPNKVSIRVKDVLMRSDLDNNEKLAELRSEEQEMTEEDVDYVISTTKDKTVVNNWAKKLKELRKELAVN